LAEGPAQGVWERAGNNYKVSFVLFAFEEKKHVGYVRVRCTLKLAAPDALEGAYQFDFIHLDGVVESGLGSGTFFGNRQKIDASGPIAEIPTTAPRSRDSAEERSALPGGDLLRRTDAKAWSRLAEARRR
jgi:hypothetical protein